MRDRKRARRVLLAIAALQVVYASAYIYRSSFTIEGKRYYCLFDDAMISMRYGANWAAGHGLVWNVGERVEGYTNFGWTLVMGVCHLLPLSPAHVCLLIQILGAVIWIALLPATAALARACRAPPLAVVMAAALTVAQWNLIFFSMNGMESGLLTLLVTLGFRGAVMSLRMRRGRVLPFCWFALAMLVRPDALLVLVFTAGLLVLFARQRWRTILGFTIVVIVVAAHVLWRKSYYDEWLPNTYYLKATGWPLVSRLHAGVLTTVWALAALALPFVLSLFRVARMRVWHGLLLGAFVIMLAYGTYVGGDAWPKHYRFVLPVTPGLMVLGVLGMLHVMGSSQATWAMRLRAWGALAVVVLIVNAPHLSHWALLNPPYGTLGNRTSVEYALAADRIAEPSATVAVAWAGAFPYYANRTCFDLLGKCDPYIARTPAHADVLRAGHNKFDTEYMLRTHDPDIVVDRLSDMPEVFFVRYHSARIDIDGDELVLAVRRGSPRIHRVETVPWERAREIYLTTRRE